MQVDLISYTPDPMRVLWVAAKTCRSQDTPQVLWQHKSHKVSRDDRIRLLRAIWENGHQSVFEHVSLTYAVSNVSRVCLAQYTRHRIGVSLSVQSQRFVRMDYAKFSYVMPPIAPGNTDQYDHYWDIRQKHEEALINAQATYNHLLSLGVSKGDARFVLPQGTATNFITTVNLRSLAHLYDLRVKKPGAQWEIKELVTWMVKLILEKEPELGEVIM